MMPFSQAVPAMGAAFAVGIYIGRLLRTPRDIAGVANRLREHEGLARLRFINTVLVISHIAAPEHRDKVLELLSADVK